MRSISRCLFALGVAAGLVSFAAFGADIEAVAIAWNVNTANTPQTAYDWNEPSNWLENTVPDATNHAAFFNATTTQYVKFTGDLDLAAFMGANDWGRYIISDDTLNFHETKNGSNNLKFSHDGYSSTIASGRALNTYTYVYAPWVASTGLSGMWTACGPIHVDNGSVVLSVGNPVVDASCYALKAGGDRTGEASFKFFTFGSGSIYFRPPRGNDEMTGTFTLTKDSCYAKHVSSTAGSANLFSSGALVSGVGDNLPAGTFVKRIFNSAQTIELSEPYTGESGDFELTFGAVTPNYAVTIGQIDMNQGSTELYVASGKYRAADTVRIIVSKLTTAYQTQQAAPSTFVFTSIGGQAAPATFAIADANGAKGYIDVRDEELEFGATGSASVEPGLPNTRGLVVKSGKTAYLCATNNIAARIGAVKNVDGTVQKNGAGSVELDFAVTNVNALVVHEGTLVLKAKDAATPVIVQSLTVEAGATLEIAEGTKIAFHSISTAAGSNITGAGTLLLHGDVDVGSATVAPTVTISFEGSAAGGGVVSPSGTLPTTSVPALWMDASQKDSLVYLDESAGKQIVEWKDRRGAGYRTSTVSADRKDEPEAWTDSSGAIRFVWIPRVDKADPKYSAALLWNAPVTGIRHVFKVHSVYNGGGSILGGTNVVDFGRNNVASWSQPVLDNASTLVKSGYLLENGVVRSMTAGFRTSPSDTAGDGNTLSEVVVPAPGAQASAFGTCGAANTVMNGCERICEVLVYTNELSYAERQQISEYLMVKWMHRHAPNTSANAPEQQLSVLSVAGRKTFGVPAGAAAQVKQLTGSGTLVKTGAGDLYLRDVTSASSLDVRAGKVSVFSHTLSAADLPAATAHFDMNDETTRTLASGSETAVSKVTDSDGGSLYLNASRGLKPTLVTSAAPDPAATTPQLKAGMKYLDFGDLIFQHENDGIDQSKQCAFSLSARQYRKYHTFFAVFGSGRGGGTGILGCAGNGYNDGYGIMRNNTLWWRPAKTGVTTNMTEEEFNEKRLDPSTPIFVSAPDGAKSTATSEFRRNGTVIDPVTTGYTGGWDLCAYRNYVSTGLGLAGLAFDHYARWTGGQLWGELVLYTDVLTDAEVDAAEAYLAKKWYDRDTVGFSAAAVDTLSLRGGTELEVTGGTALAMNAFALSCDVNADGSFDAATVTGTATWPDEATVTLGGARAALRAGTHTLLSGANLKADSIAGWSLVVPEELSTGRAFALAVTDAGDLTVKVSKKGFAAILR